MSGVPPGDPGFIWSVRIYYEDTDAGGVVYHSNYLKFMERARTEWLRALGFEQDVLARQEGVLFAVRSLTVDYRSPARFNDCLDVVCWLVEQGGASLVFHQEVRPEREGKCLCSARVKVACLDAGTLRPRPIPKLILEQIHPKLTKEDEQTPRARLRSKAERQMLEAIRPVRCGLRISQGARQGKPSQTKL